MTEFSAISALRVANEAFLVASMIERCPRTMMLRELVMNGIEAAEHTAEGRRLVCVTVRPIEGIPKLCIWNTGKGLSAAELLQITDLASSLRKENSLDKNFGMGAKVASLPSNRHGLRYRSCHGSRVNEVMLGQRDGIYGRLRRGERGDEVLDVTDLVQAEGDHKLDADWTEVVLLGNSATQNTVTDPYSGNPHVAAGWLTNYLEQRFFRLPADLEIILTCATTGEATDRRMLGAVSTWNASEHKESVTTPSGITLHYSFHAPFGTVPGTPGSGFGCVVYRNEMYDLRLDQKWILDAPSYGITFGAAFVSVFVELPEDYLVWPEAYRQFLRFRGGDQRQVYLLDFGPLIRVFMPDWLRRLIRALGPQQADYLDDVNNELRDLLAVLEVPLSRRDAAILNADKPKLAAKDAEKEQGHTTLIAGKESIERHVVPPASKPKSYERPPEIIGLRSEAMISERALQGRMAKFYPQSHQLFLNLTYPAIIDMADTLAAVEQDMAAGDLDPEMLRRMCLEVAEWCITRKVSRALIYSLAKKTAGWAAEEVSRAQSPECLSLVADDWQGMMDVARQRLATILSADPSLNLPANVAA